MLELRIPGIGGPAPESVLACPPGTSFVEWRSEPAARSTVRRGPVDPQTLVYDWRPLTSGSRGFLFWPLLLPFTLGNVAGFMGPPSGRWRTALHRFGAVLIGLVLTGSAVVWLFVAAVAVWFDLLADTELPSWLPGENGHWAFWLAATSVALALTALVLTATHVAEGYERFRPSSWPQERWSWRGPWGASLGRTFDDPRFYDNGGDHKVRWWIHCGVAVSVWAGLVAAVVVADGPTRPQPALDWSVAVMAVATCVPVAILSVAAVGSPRPWGWRLVAPAAAVLAATLLGGAVLSALIAFVGLDAVPLGPVGMLYDVYGWGLLAALGATVAITVAALLDPAPAERHAVSRPLLPTLPARLRARLAVVPGRIGPAAVVFAVAFAVGVVAAVVTRWLPDDERDRWVLTPTAPVDIARLTFVFLIGFMFLNGLKQLGDPRALRRVGNVWDILTFWPRTFHPFAVRPYAERAVPEVQEFLLAAASSPHRRSDVVVVAHSQGSVVAYAAFRGAAGRVDHLRMVTAGSPLRSIYLAVFPWYVGDDRTGATGGRRVAPLPVEWVNVFRFTDHVGRAVFASDDVVATGLAPGADRPIPDPLPGRAVMGHNDYWSDPNVAAVVRRPSMRRTEEVPGGHR